MWEGSRKMGDIGERLKNLRKNAGITQADLAEKLNVHLQTVSKWERGISVPDIGQLGELAAALRVSLEKLCGQEEPKETYVGDFSAERLGKMIGQLRVERSESQEQLANALNTSSDAVSRWERGVTCPDVQKLIELAGYFGVPVSKLYCGIGQEQETETVAVMRKRRRVSALFVAAAALMVCVVCAVLVLFLPRRSVDSLETVVYTVSLDGEQVSVSADDWFVPEIPERDGYEFVCWVDETGNAIEFPCKITKDSEFSSVFQPRKYKIDYWLNGGFFETSPQSTFDVENGAVELLTPQKTGETFEGWYLSADYSGEQIENLVCAGADVSVYAKWSSTVYTVRYQLNGGVLYEENPSLITAEQETVLEEPIRKGYIFLGWYDEPQGGTRYDRVGGDGVKNLLLYALWQQSDELYSVLYDLNGGKTEGENPVSVGAGEIYHLYGAERVGYDFLGWNTEPDGSGEYLTYLSGIEESLHLYAMFEAKEYLIRYEYSGVYEENANPNFIKYGERVELNNVYLYGYVFVGWYDASEGGNRIEVIDESNILGLTVLYARYTPLEYEITVDACGGKIETADGLKSDYTYALKFGETLLLPVGIREGYDFLGWSDASGNLIEKIDTLNIGNLNLTALWRETEHKYQISYELNGGELLQSNPETVYSGQVLPLYQPEREGYLFLGWYDNKDGSGNEYVFTPADREEDLILYAIWQEIRINGSSAFFTYEKGAKSVTITGYTGESGENVVVNVPAIIEDLPVTSVECMFNDDHDNIIPDMYYYKSIIIPEGVLTLGSNMFFRVEVKEPFEIPASVVQIMPDCFKSCKMEVRFAEGSKITTIGESAFANCFIPCVFTVPEGVETIGRNAFRQSLLFGIILPETLKRIEDCGLYLNTVRCSCYGIYLPDSLEYVGSEGIRSSGEIWTSLSAEETATFLPNWNSQKVHYNVSPFTVTLQDGENIEQLSGNVFELPQPEKNGFYFVGWKDGKGNFVDRYYVPEKNITLYAVYEKNTDTDGRVPEHAAVLSLNSVYEMNLTGTEWYFTIQTQKPVKISVQYFYDFGNYKIGSDSYILLYYSNGTEPLKPLFKNDLIYTPGGYFMIDAQPTPFVVNIKIYVNEISS